MVSAWRGGSAVKGRISRLFWSPASGAPRKLLATFATVARSWQSLTVPTSLSGASESYLQIKLRVVVRSYDEFGRDSRRRGFFLSPLERSGIRRVWL
jgi:hypothetical protein